MKYTIGSGVILMLVWLAWSGHYTPLLLSLGLASTLWVVAVGRRMGVLDEEGVHLDNLHRMARYLPWLLWEIVKANLHVARRILDPRLPVSPRVIEVETGQRTELGRVIYANSITLTPGTVSMDLRDGKIVVHALTREAAEGLQSGEMNRRVCSTEAPS